jgi:hypothetical protein
MPSALVILNRRGMTAMPDKTPDTTPDAPEAPDAPDAPEPATPATLPDPPAGEETVAK